MRTDVLIIGGGLAGMSAALSAQQAGAQTTVVCTGMGVLFLSSGCIDLMAYPNDSTKQAVDNPLEAIAQLRTESPHHPYARIPETDLIEALEGFKEACARQQWMMVGDGRRNFLIPTSLGSAKPTAFVPSTMQAGDLSDASPMTLVGLAGFRDFFVDLAAQQIRSGFGIQVDTATFDPLESMAGGTVSTVNLGRAFESVSFCEDVARFINTNVPGGQRVGIPAVLGVDGALMAHRTLEELTGRRIFEIPILPPSLPGRRIAQALKREFFEIGGQLINGCPVLSATSEKGRVRTVTYKTGEVLQKTVEAKATVLATGSFFSGGLICRKKTIEEPVFGLPICDEPAPDKRYSRDFLAKGGHPVGKAGLRVNTNFMPCDIRGEAIYTNLFACGDLIGGFDSLWERCGGGVAIATGTQAGKRAAKAAAG